MTSKISVCIACHNQEHLLYEALDSCGMQDYPNLEIIVLDDASTKPIVFNHALIKRTNGLPMQFTLLRSDSPSGTGGSFNKAMNHASGDYIVLLCADDVFTDKSVLSDIAEIFEKDQKVGHVTRFYHQFIDGNRKPVRAWRTYDPIEQANNPSGLAFRRSALKKYIQLESSDPEKNANPPLAEGMKELSNKMFVEAAMLVSQVFADGWKYDILEYDTVAVRIHNSISQNKGYYLKMWKGSPVEEWNKLGGGALLNDFTSLIQIKNNFVLSAVIKECWNFIRLKPSNLLSIGFWFYAAVSILTPRSILRHLPNFYRITAGRWFTREVKRA